MFESIQQSMAQNPRRHLSIGSMLVTACFGFSATMFNYASRQEVPVKVPRDAIIKKRTTGSVTFAVPATEIARVECGGTESLLDSEHNPPVIVAQAVGALVLCKVSEDYPIERLNTRKP